MKNITEKKLKNLGFKKTVVTPEESGAAGFSYYTFDFGDKYPLSLITNSNDECVDNMYWVEIFDYPNVGRFTDINALIDFIEIVKNLEKPENTNE